MPRSNLLVAALLVALLPAAALGQSGEDPEARKQRIVDNLRVEYPQLQGVEVVIEELAPSALGGFEEGTLVVGGQQRQKFLVSSDDKALYLVGSGPIDVSRSSEELAAELERQKAAAAGEALARRRQLEELSQGSPVRGNPEAPVTIVEFSDFQCPYCARGANTVEEILEKYPDDVKFVFQHFPLDFHPWAKPAAIASVCAARQDVGAFWVLHDKYFENQKAINPDNVLAKSREFLEGTGVDLAGWAACAEDRDSEQYKSASREVDEAMRIGQQLGVSGTPGFFVNGRFLSGAQPLDAFEPLIAEAKNDAGS